jgi:nucleotide-binding universal stress UspA family protein
MASKHSTPSPQAEPSPLSGDTGTAQLREIVAFIDGRTETTSILEFAGLLAEEHSARMIVVFMQPSTAVTTAQSFARGKGIEDVIKAQDARLEHIEADHRTKFEGIARRHGIRSEWRSVPYLSDEVAVNAYYADLVVTARPDPDAHTASPPGLAESLVLSSGRPVIVFPPRSTVSRIRRILVSWNAKRESIRAVADAMPLLVKAEAVEVLVVGRDRQAPGHGEEPGADIARHLASHGVRADVRRVESGGEDVGHLMLSQAASFRADLLVMGAYGHSNLSQWIFGSVTRTILYDTGLPVLMSR